MSPYFHKRFGKAAAILPIMAGIFALLSQLSFAQSTLCESEEQVFWSCSDDDRIYSLCGKVGQTPVASYMQYRAGNVENTKLVFPASQAPAADHFRYQLLNRAAVVHFENEGFQYSIYESINAEASIDVEKAGKRLISISCDRSSDTLTLTPTMNQFKAMGIYD